MKKIQLIFLSFLMLIFGSCSDFLDINVNPDKAITVTAEKELPVIIFYAAQMNYDHAEYGNYLAQT
ncbi:MAG TPA: SusD/RagB family nutrient-binding outer membrane lipoprotein, partial [Bacteroidia bacterium]|nr:SusD/RagB family nutrient-binding outer membrane lipoprotein [Bacteroidia bacterium]